MDRAGRQELRRARPSASSQQFDGYYVEKDLHENGELIQGEKIADLGGLTIAYRAYQKSLKGKPEPAPIDGLTPDQRFFVANARIWAREPPAGVARLMVKTNPHAPRLPGHRPDLQPARVREGLRLQPRRRRWCARRDVTELVKDRSAPSPGGRGLGEGPPVAPLDLESEETKTPRPCRPLASQKRGLRPRPALK